MTEPFEKVPKLEGARRVTTEAIRLFFERRDALAVHTLAAAAHEVLSDICKHKGLPTFIKNNPHMPPDKKKEWLYRFNIPFNFLKHAKNDPEGILTFPPRATEILIFDSASMYGKIFGSYPREFRIYGLWYFMKYPETSTEGLPSAKRALARGISPDNFEHMLMLLNLPPEALEGSP